MVGFQAGMVKCAVILHSDDNDERRIVMTKLEEYIQTAINESRQILFDNMCDMNEHIRSIIRNLLNNQAPQL